MRRLAIDLSAMANLIDGDVAGFVVDLIDHPKVALTDAVAILIARQLL
jgi:hypothetical protein